MTDATPDATPGPAPEDLDAIAAALAHLRGRGRGPGGGPGFLGFPGFPGGPGGPGFSGGGPFGHGPRGRSRHDWMHGESGDHGDHGVGSQGSDGERRPGDHGGTGGHGGPRGFGAEGWGAGRMAGPARLRLLEALAGASHPLSVSEVGEAIGVDQPRASRLIQQAVDLGLVRREADPDDARRTRAVLTDDGAKIVRGFRGQRREHLSQALEGFTAAERTELARLLTKLAEAWPQA